MVLSSKNFHINSILFTNLIFAFFPISFILGNLITNINLILFCGLGIFHLRSKILTTSFELPIKIIFLFFFIVFFSTSLSFIKSLYLEEYQYFDLIKLIKSIVFFRFFLMLIIVYLLSKFNILNFKYFFLSASFAPLLVSLDVIYQYIFGFDMIGLEKGAANYNSGFFGDELIAGGFIENFSFFLIISVAFLFKNKNNLRFILTIFVIGILGLGILLSGNRMPLILFIMGLFLFFLFNKELKKIILTSFLVLFIIFGFIGSFDSEIRTVYQSFYANAKYTLFSTINMAETNISEKDKLKTISEEEDLSASTPLDSRKYTWQKFKKNLKWYEGKPLQEDFEFSWVLQEGNVDGQLKLFFTSLDIWKKNKIFGNGIKSFREDCKKFLIHKKNRLCSNHPHNYYLEILTETGIVGLFITSIIGLLFVIFIYKNSSFLRENNIENLILLAITISIISETFPFKSTGSIFSTNNMTYLILIASILLSYRKRLNM